MSWAANLLVVAAAALADGDARAGAGAQTVAIQATVEILLPAIVRQASGWVADNPDSPRPQITRKDRVILIEFQ